MILVLPVALLLVLAELPTRTLAIVAAFAVLIRGYPAWSARTIDRLADAPDPMVQREIERILPERLAAEPDPVVRLRGRAVAARRERYTGARSNPGPSPLGPSGRRNGPKEPRGGGTPSPWTIPPPNARQRGAEGPSQRRAAGG